MGCRSSQPMSLWDNITPIPVKSPDNIAVAQSMTKNLLFLVGRWKIAIFRHPFISPSSNRTRGSRRYYHVPSQVCQVYSQGNALIFSPNHHIERVLTSFKTTSDYNFILCTIYFKTSEMKVIKRTVLSHRPITHWKSLHGFLLIFFQLLEQHQKNLENNQDVFFVY